MQKGSWIQVSIVKMQKIAVIGLDKQKESIMSRLMDFGAVELTDQKNKLSDETLSSIVTLWTAMQRPQSLTPDSAAAENALLFLEKHDKAKEPLFKTRRIMKQEAARQIDMESAEEDIRKILELEERLKDANDQMNKLDQEEILITPWLGMRCPLK